jgi:threonine/homoserine/homoserine lactone efflux protein
MDIILKGIATGLVLALLIGPVFFTLLQTSIERGFWSGALVAVGVSLSDALYIFLAYLGLSRVLTNQHAHLYMAYGGGLILFGFGAYYLFVKSRKAMNFQTANIKARHPLSLVSKGFIINGLSPMVLVFWLGTVSVATGEFGYNSPATASLFFTSIIATVFTTDLIKAKLADNLRKVLTPRFVRVMNIALGVVLVIFGGRLIFFADHLRFL